MKKTFTAPGTCSSQAGNSGSAATGFGQKIIPFYRDETTTLYCGDCREIVPALPEIADLLLTDPPYSQVRPEAWDRINQSQLCRMLDELFRAVRPMLSHNAAVYVFAWPTNAGMIEYIMTRHFNVLNHIVWSKRDQNGLKIGIVNKAHLPELRNYFPETERIIFAEQRGADGAYNRNIQALGNEIFRPIIEYFRKARRDSGLSGAEIRSKMFELTGRRYVFERHAFSYSQWEFPSEEQFLAAATFLPLGDHGDALLSYRKARETYEALRVKYEHVRRFHLARKRNYTDLWQYRTIKPGDPERIHPCQKPLDMLCDIIETSTRPGALVLDCFAGSGQTAVAARKTGRRCILIERDPEYCRAIARRLSLIH